MGKFISIRSAVLMFRFVLTYRFVKLIVLKSFKVQTLSVVVSNTSTSNPFCTNYYSMVQLTGQPNRTTPKSNFFYLLSVKIQNRNSRTLQFCYHHQPIHPLLDEVSPIESSARICHNHYVPHVD